MRLPTQSTVAFVTMLTTLAACGAAPDAASEPPTGTVALASTDPTPSAAPTTTTQQVTVTQTSVAATTTSVPAVADPGDLYALDLASGGISRLTTDRRLEGCPRAWMPDGERLLVGRFDSGTDPTTGNADIFIVAADGTAEQRLTDHPASDLTARDDFAICTIDVSTAAINVFTDDEADDFYPAWSPDGDTIAFARAFDAR